jgi:hypothetical protein
MKKSRSILLFFLSLIESLYHLYLTDEKDRLEMACRRERNQIFHQSGKKENSNEMLFLWFEEKLE